VATTIRSAPVQSFSVIIAGMGRVTAFAVFFCLALAAAASADSDHDRAREAVLSGEVVPLRDILMAAERDFAGEFLEVELEREDGRWIYEIKLLSTRGEIVKLKYDARTRELIGAKGRDVDSVRRQH